MFTCSGTAARPAQASCVPALGALLLRDCACIQTDERRASSDSPRAQAGPQPVEPLQPRFHCASLRIGVEAPQGVSSARFTDVCLPFQVASRGAAANQPLIKVAPLVLGRERYLHAGL